MAKNLMNFDSVALRSWGSFAWVVSTRRLKYAEHWFLKVIRFARWQ